MRNPTPARPKAAPPRSSVAEAPLSEEAPPRVYSGQFSAKQSIQGTLALSGLPAFFVFVLALVFSASFSQALVAAGGVGLAAAAFLAWAQFAYKPPGYTLYPDRLEVGPSRARHGVEEGRTLSLRDLGHLGYDGHSCVLRYGPRPEDSLTLVMKHQEMDDLWEHLVRFRGEVDPELPYSVHRDSDRWLSDPYLLERDPVRLSGRLRVGWEGMEGRVDEGAGTPVRFVLEREGPRSNEWLVLREGESRPRLGIRRWSLRWNVGVFDVFDGRGVHVAQFRRQGLTQVELEFGSSRTLTFTWEDSRQVVREGERVLLEFPDPIGARVVVLDKRGMPQALFELLVLAQAASYQMVTSD